MASNSRLVLLLLPLFLLTAMVAIAAAQPPDDSRTVTVEVLEHLTDIIKWKMIQLNAGVVRDAIFETPGVMQQITRPRIVEDQVGFRNLGSYGQCYIVKIVATAFYYRTVPGQALPSITIRHGVEAIAAIAVLNGNFNHAFVQLLTKFFPLPQP
ncbi:hypothetical protein AXF42_Ash000661 [Apostasia shenzhenica]|uniref:Uncharacterized protein n=1 Tax=Apostasia shenzhenica TaxID=1088818 RepID=A0A2I0AH55_9ASPA|nr:hypothetical protein AXF42_Ash000661 [Apostasia shenzhenica]